MTVTYNDSTVVYSSPTITYNGELIVPTGVRAGPAPIYQPRRTYRKRYTLAWFAIWQITVDIDRQIFTDRTTPAGILELDCGQTAETCREAAGGLQISTWRSRPVAVQARSGLTRTVGNIYETTFAARADREEELMAYLYLAVQMTEPVEVMEPA